MIQDTNFRFLFCCREEFDRKTVWLTDLLFREGSELRGTEGNLYWDLLTWTNPSRGRGYSEVSYLRKVKLKIEAYYDILKPEMGEGAVEKEQPTFKVGGFWKCNF